MSLYFCSNSVTWPLLQGSPRILPKLKNYLSLSFSDKPPHFTPVQPPDGKSSVFLFVFFFFPLVPSLTTAVSGDASTNDLGRQIPQPLKWAAVCTLCQISSPFWSRHCQYGRHVARSARSFDLERIFWWLDLIHSAPLVGPMFNTCYHSSIHLHLIGSNSIISTISLGIPHYWRQLGVCGPLAKSSTIISLR